MQETWVRFLGQEDPLEKEMATHSITLAWKVPWTEEPGRLQSMGSQRVGHDRATSPQCFSTSLFTQKVFSLLHKGHNIGILSSVLCSLKFLSVIALFMHTLALSL